MTDFGIARAVHLIMVVLWIGGVAMVTTVLLPGIRRSHPPPERFGAFQAIEARFARQSRWTTALAGFTGFYMLWRIDAWARFTTAEFWWMHAMVLTWLVFILMLFILEPLVLHRWLERRAAADPEATCPAGRTSALGIADPWFGHHRRSRRRRCGCQPGRVLTVQRR